MNEKRMHELAERNEFIREKELYTREITKERLQNVNLIVPHPPFIF